MFALVRNRAGVVRLIARDSLTSSSLVETAERDDVARDSRTSSGLVETAERDDVARDAGDAATIDIALPTRNTQLSTTDEN